MTARTAADLPTAQQTIIYDHVRRGRPERALQAARGDGSVVAEAVAAVREYRAHLGFEGEPRAPLRTRRTVRRETFVLRSALQIDRGPSNVLRSALQIDRGPSNVVQTAVQTPILRVPTRTVAQFTRPAPDPLWRPLCMSTEDYGGWLVFNDKLRATQAQPAERPCEDCPTAYAAEMRAESMCNGQPGLVR